MDELQHRGRLVDDHIPVAMALKNVEILTAQQCIAFRAPAHTMPWRISSMESKLPQHSADEGGDRAAQQRWLSEHRYMHSARAPIASFVKQIDRAPDIGIL